MLWIATGRCYCHKYHHEVGYKTLKSEFVRLSNDPSWSKAVSMRQLVRAIKRFQDAVDLFDTEAAPLLDVNGTDASQRFAIKVK